MGKTAKLSRPTYTGKFRKKSPRNLTSMVTAQLPHVCEPAQKGGGDVSPLLQQRALGLLLAAVQ